MFSFRRAAAALGLTHRASGQPKDSETAQAQKRAASQLETERLIASLREEQEGKRLRERYDAAKRIVQDDIKKYGWFWPSDRR